MNIYCVRWDAPHMEQPHYSAMILSAESEKEARSWHPAGRPLGLGKSATWVPEGQEDELRVEKIGVVDNPHVPTDVPQVFMTNFVSKK